MSVEKSKSRQVISRISSGKFPFHGKIQAQAGRYSSGAFSALTVNTAIHRSLSLLRPPGRGAFFVMSLDFSKFAPINRDLLSEPYETFIILHFISCDSSILL